MHAPSESDAEWHGRELNRHASRANAAATRTEIALEALNELQELLADPELAVLPRGALEHVLEQFKTAWDAFDHDSLEDAP